MPIPGQPDRIRDAKKAAITPFNEIVAVESLADFATSNWLVVLC
jgi:hypothetical protein